MNKTIEDYQNDRSRYLTDLQFLDLLRVILKTLSQPGFKRSCYDSTDTGDKYTESNCGCCNNNFTNKKTAMWPDEFPGRKTMKHRKTRHLCPFDSRDKGGANGCFYTCMLFRGGNRLRNPKFVIQLVKDRICQHKANMNKRKRKHEKS
jgi:hypothetical protein